MVKKMQEQLSKQLIENEGKVDEAIREKEQV
jgi:hypothetical protein